MRLDRRQRRVALAVAVWFAALVAPAADVETVDDERFPVITPATRVQAVTTLTGGAPLATDCLTPRLAALRHQPLRSQPSAVRRALPVLFDEATIADERSWLSPDGDTWRFTHVTDSFDHVDAVDRDQDRVPDPVQRVRGGMVEARRLLVERLGLPSPGPVEVLLADLGRHVNGYTLPGGGSDGAPLLVINAARTASDLLADTAAHQFAHAVAARMGHGVATGWAEALSNWAVLHLNGAPTEQVLRLMALRLERMGEGLLADDMDLAGGNALWLAFMDESYGPESVARLARELATTGDGLAAVERAVHASGGQSLRAAFRDFHLWSVLVGERDDGRHFSFADRLPSPAFAGGAAGLPALSVQSEPAIGPFGAAQILLRPDAPGGGLSVLFEGALQGPWEADLLLLHDDGSLYRVPVPLDEDGRGELTAPLDRLEQAILLVRNLADDAAAPAGRYTWSAHRERSFPFRLGGFEAAPGAQGVEVSWETLSEQELLGFNVLRIDEATGRTVRINPVWIPAVGGRDGAVSYRFIDSTAAADGHHVYRIEGVTVHGLTSLSEPFSISPPLTRN